MSEVVEHLERALRGPIELTFDSSDEARRWVYRALNHIRRSGVAELRRIMVTQRRNVITLRVPNITVRHLTEVPNQET